MPSQKSLPFLFRRPGLQPRRKARKTNWAFALFASAGFWRKPLKKGFLAFFRSLLEHPGCPGLNPLYEVGRPSVAACPDLVGEGGSWVLCPPTPSPRPPSTTLGGRSGACPDPIGSSEIAAPKTMIFPKPLSPVISTGPGRLLPSPRAMEAPPASFPEAPRDRHSPEWRFWPHPCRKVAGCPSLVVGGWVLGFPIPSEYQFRN